MRKASKHLIFILLMSILVMSGCSSSAKTYVGSINSDKYHKPSCQWAQRINSENEIWFSSKEDAADHGYVACKVCKP